MPAKAPEHRINAAILDLAMWGLGGLREKIVAEAQGRVLEIGAGTGLNLPIYKGIERLDAVEPDPHMLRRARKRAEGLGRDFEMELHACGGESLPFADSSFDTAVVTWVLCTVPDPEAALAEAYRVLAPGGRLIFVEHTRSRFDLAHAMQRRLTPVWRYFAGGCHLDRDAVALVEAAGFREVQVRPRGREGWTLFPMYSGSAIR